MGFNIECRRAVVAAVLTGTVALSLGAHAQGVSPPAAAPGSAQFPGLPLKRDADAGDSIAGSLGWAAVFLAALAGAGYVLVRGKQRPGQRASLGRWLQKPVEGPSLPKRTGQSNLTQQASLHVVEWHGEELLLGCTSQSVALLARRPVAKADDAKEKA